MTSKSEKENRKELLRELKRKEQEAFVNSLPVKKEIFFELFNYLDNNLDDNCDHQMGLTKEFLNKKEIKNIDQVIVWLNDKGGYCDCEIMFNVEEQFEFLKGQ